MKNAHINRSVIKKIASALGELNERVVYVGGAVMGLYIDDPAADDVRPTQDLDVSLEIVSLSELERIREDLVIKGFVQNFEDNITCRFRYEGIIVDVMATKQIGWAPANAWFDSGFKSLLNVKVDEQQIKILSLAYFLASKFAAFNDRGKHDSRTSKDFEDITYVLDNRTDLSEQIRLSPPMSEIIYKVNSKIFLWMMS